MELKYLTRVIVSLVFGVVRAENYFCETNLPNGNDVVRYEGKMNVPIKPAVEPEAVLFLWPGVNPYAGQGGMMQPVLTYGADYGQGSQVWGMSNWFTACPTSVSASGYCHGEYLAVDEGDTLSFSMQYIQTYPNGSRAWEMSWSAANGGQSDDFMVYWETGDVSSIWSTEAEFYLEPSDTSNYDKLPQSPFYTWDLKAITSSGIEYPLSYTANGGSVGDIQVNCALDVEANGYTFADATELTMPEGGCDIPGYSRNWSYSCNTYCGCNNPDGTPKITCDYCCAVIGNSCYRDQGPSYTHSKNSTTAVHGVINDELPRPGDLALKYIS